MYDKIDFTERPAKGQRDNKRRHYLCLASADPERIRIQRWEIKVTTSFGYAVRQSAVLLGTWEFWSGSVVVSKAPDGELSVAYARFAPLTGWAGDDCWYCWGSRVLVGCICNLENETDYKPELGGTWTTWREGPDDYYPHILPTRIPSSQWPLNPREGREPDES